MKYNYEITFQKLDETLREQEQLGNVDITALLKESDVIKKLQECIEHVNCEDCYTILTRA